MFRKSNIKFLRIIILVIFCLFILSWGLYTLIIYLQFEPGNIEFSTTSSKIFDRNKEFLWEVSKDNSVRNTPVNIETLPKYCIDGIVAIEDKTFWTNNGIDLNGLMRLIISIFSRGNLGGGSTISQQVIKNSFQNIYDRDGIDKYQEILYALKINAVIKKEKILEMYLNNIYFGDLNYGIESASKNYFGKSSSELNLPECAFIAGIPQWPGVYNPMGNLEKGVARQKVVLSAMKKEGFISEEEYENALNYELEFNISIPEVRAPHFTQFIKDSLLEKFGNQAYKSLSIETTYDYRIHKDILSILKKHINQRPNTNLNNAATVVLDKDNKLLVMIGSVDFFNDEIDGKFNSTLGLRQPGPAYIPVIYSMALEKGFQEDSVLDSTPLSLTLDDKEIQIKNFVDSEFLTLKESLLSSSLAPSVRILEELKPETFEILINDYTYFNNTPTSCKMTLLLEGCEISLMDLTSIYASNFLNDNSIKFVNKINEKDINEMEVTFKRMQQSENIKKFLYQNDSTKWFIQYGEVFNNKDFFAIALNQNYTVGVWSGNTRGEELLEVPSSFIKDLVTDITKYLSYDN